MKLIIVYEPRRKSRKEEALLRSSYEDRSNLKGSIPCPGTFGLARDPVVPSLFGDISRKFVAFGHTNS